MYLRLIIALFLLCLSLSNALALTLEASSKLSQSTTKKTEHRVAKRIVALTPHLTELAFSAGLGQYLIAVSEYSDYPKKAKSLETVANYQGIKLERILALKPDLVIAWKEGPGGREVKMLQNMGIHVIMLNTTNLSSIANNIEILSQYSNDPKVGLQKAQSYRQQLKKITLENQTKPKVRFFYQLSDQPLMSVAGKGWASEIFSRCNGHNILEKSKVPYPQINKEQVLQGKPDVIFSSQFNQNIFDLWQNWQAYIPAIQNHQVYQLNPDWMSRPTYRTLNALQQVCDALDQARMAEQIKPLQN